MTHKNAGLSLLLALLFAGIALGQTSAGAIVGVVRDPSNAVIPEASIAVTNLGTNVSFRFVTDATGNYFVPSLIPGRYKVEAEKAGFKKVTVPEVIVAVSQTLRVDLSMPVGEVLSR